MNYLFIEEESEKGGGVLHRNWIVLIIRINKILKSEILLLKNWNSLVSLKREVSMDLSYILLAYFIIY